MPTTLNRNDELLSEAKAVVAREKLTLIRWIEEGWTLRLHQQQRPMPCLLPAAPCRCTGQG